MYIDGLSFIIGVIVTTILFIVFGMHNHDDMGGDIIA